MDLLQWWNLIFLLPAVAALLYLLLISLGAIPAEGHDIDAGDAGHVELHGHVDHPDGDPFHGALSLIGVGRVPLSLILMSFAFLWGFFGWFGTRVFGWFGTRVFGMFLSPPELFVWPSLVLALVGAGVFTRVLAGGLGRLMPGTESYGAEARELIGRMADVRYALTATTGTVQLHDQHGSIHEVPARVLPGEDAIPSGTRVVLWRYDEHAGAYFAVQDEALSGIETESGIVQSRQVG